MIFHYIVYWFCRDSYATFDISKVIVVTANSFVNGVMLIRLIRIHNVL